jgi:NAD(P)-dependent dehydrogenase (short-subunit alcohol dehydrogenase family)
MAGSSAPLVMENTHLMVDTDWYVYWLATHQPTGRVMNEFLKWRIHVGKLNGKVALVTGAARGIGAAIAYDMASEGAKVVLTDIDQEAAESAANAIRNEGWVGIAILHDVTNPDSWATVVAEAERQLGSLDILVNNAGILAVQSIAETSLEDFHRVSAVNTDGVFLGIKHGFASMGTRGGSIINVSSLGGMIGAAGQLAYGASKGAVRLMTKCAMAEAAALGLPIRCNSIHPGVIHTPMTETFYGFGRGTGLDEMFAAAIPSGRLGTPQDVARAAVYLASEDASYVNGAELMVDGGILAAPIQKPKAPQ